MPLPPEITGSAVRRAAGLLSRQQDRDLGALAEFAVDLDRSAGLMSEAVDLGKAKPRALADRLGREEGIKDPAQYVWSDAGTGIRNGNGDIVAAVACLRTF